MAVTALASPDRLSFTGSTIGRKAIMAASGVILFGFVLGHMAGNYAWMISQMGAGFGPGGCHGNFVPPSNS